MRRWGILLGGLIAATVAIVALTLWQIAADTPPLVQHGVQIVRVPIPVQAPGTTIINHYLPVPTVPAPSVTVAPSPAPRPTTTTTTRAPAPPTTAPHPAPCTTVPVLGTCLP